jgi:hypothetical protein
MKPASQGWLAALAVVVTVVAAVAIFSRDGPAPDISLEEGTLRAPASDRRLSIAVGSPSRPDLNPIFPLPAEDSAFRPPVATASEETVDRLGPPAARGADEAPGAVARRPAREPAAVSHEVVVAGCPRGSARAEEQTTRGMQRPGRPSTPACPHDDTRAGARPDRAAEVSRHGTGGRTR